METNQTGKPRLKTLWRLSWPAIIEQVLTTMVSYADTAMVGVLGAAGTAAVSVNAAPIWLANGLLTGVGVGYSVQVSNAIGARDDEKARRVIRQGVLAAIVVGLLGLLLYQSLAGFIPRWLGAEPEVLPQAVAYLRFYTMAMPFMAAGQIFSAILRCMGNTRAPLYFNTAANLLNIVLNFLLIYPTRPAVLFGAQITIPGAGLGAAGAAIASAAALTTAGIALLRIGTRQGDRFRVHLREGLRPDGAIIRQAVRLGLPSAVERATINLGQIATTAVVASLGTVALAANQIAVTAEGLCYLPAYGISYAGIALVGQAVGARKKEDARAYGTLAAKLGFVVAIGTASALFLLAPPLAACSTPTPGWWSRRPSCCASWPSASPSSPCPSSSPAPSGAPTTCVCPWWWGWCACGASGCPGPRAGLLRRVRPGGGVAGHGRDLIVGVCCAPCAGARANGPACAG